MKTTDLQSGIILVSVLIFLFLLTLITLAGMDTAVLETKLSQNYHHQQIAFEAAEAGLKQAEHDIESKGKTYLKIKNSLNDLKISWWQLQTQGSFPDANVYYVIEQWPITECMRVGDKEIKKVLYYRIGSYGAAKSGSAPTILQANFARAINEPCEPTDARKLTLGQLSWQQLK